MTVLVVTAAYILAALLTARWFYRVNVEDGNIDTDSINDIMLSVAGVLVIGALWPVVLAWIGATRFITKSTREDQILTAIDAALSGHTESDPIGFDAMRWSPTEASHDDRLDERQALREQMARQAALYGSVTAIVRDGEITEVLDGPREYGYGGEWHEVRAVTLQRGTDGESVPVHLSPGEAMVPGPNGPIHIRGAYGDQPAEVTEIDKDDREDEWQ